MSSFNSMNKVMILGRLGRDPELKYAPSGTAICSFSVATSESVKKGDSWEDKTEWHNIVVFGNTGESCSKFLKKGSLCFVEGRIQTRSYQDKDGNDRYKTEIIAGSVKFLDVKENATTPGERNSNQGASTPAETSKFNKTVSSTLTNVSEEDDDLPF